MSKKDREREARQRKAKAERKQVQDKRRADREDLESELQDFLEVNDMTRDQFNSMPVEMLKGLRPDLVELHRPNDATGRYQWGEPLS